MHPSGQPSARRCQHRTSLLSTGHPAQVRVHALLPTTSWVWGDTQLWLGMQYHCKPSPCWCGSWWRHAWPQRTLGHPPISQHLCGCCSTDFQASAVGAYRQNHSCGGDHSAGGAARQQGAGMRGVQRGCGQLGGAPGQSWPQDVSCASGPPCQAPAPGVSWLARCPRDRPRACLSRRLGSCFRDTSA